MAVNNASAGWLVGCLRWVALVAVFDAGVVLVCYCCATAVLLRCYCYAIALVLNSNACYGSGDTWYDFTFYTMVSYRMV